ncbi:1319_t:CDS:1, partial [Funneliformis geosporum]
NNEMKELKKLINHLSGNDYLIADDYIYINDEFEGEITDNNNE